MNIFQRFGNIFKQRKAFLNDIKAMSEGYGGNQYQMSQYMRARESILNQFNRQFSHYDAAGTGRLNNDWPTTYNTPTANLKNELKNLIARSTNSVDNDPHTKAIQNTLISNIIGTGLRPTPRIKDKGGKLVTGINSSLAEGWKRYGDQWDATGKNTHAEMQKVRFNELFTTGTTLTNKVKSIDGNYLGISNQVISVLRLDTSKDWDTPSYSHPDYSQTVFGINLDAYGRHISSWIQGIDKPISANMLNIAFKQTVAEQYIGVPWIATALQYLWFNLNLVKDKSLASKIQSMVTLYVPDSVAKGLYEKDLDSSDRLKWESGEIWHGETGDVPQVIQADDSIKNVLEPLQRLLLHAITMTIGISYQTTTRDLVKTNMASGRINTNEDKKTYEYIQRLFAKVVLQPDWNEYVFRMFLEGKVPGHTVGDYLKDPWKFNECQWQYTGFKFIDPEGEAKAAIELKNNGMLSLQEYYAEKGQDWRAATDQNLEEEKYIQEKRKELGIEDPLEKKPTFEPNPNRDIKKDDSD